MFPRGATDDQLVWRLGAAGIRLSASELLSGLNSLAERGEVIRDAAGRWKPAPHPDPQNKSKDRAVGHATDSSSGTIRGVSAIWRPCAQKDETTIATEPAEAKSNDLPAWPHLASYTKGPHD